AQPLRHGFPDPAESPTVGLLSLGLQGRSTPFDGQERTFLAARSITPASAVREEPETATRWLHRTTITRSSGRWRAIVKEPGSSPQLVEGRSRGGVGRPLGP